MLSDTKKKIWDRIDEIAAEHGYVANAPRPLIVEYKYREMSNYCRNKGVKHGDLSEDELTMFRYDEPLVYT